MSPPTRDSVQSPSQPMDATLDHSEAFYRSLVETLPQNFLRKDLAGRFTFVNSRFCATIGVKYADVIGKTDFDLFPAELAAKYQADDHHVISTGERIEMVESHQGPSGTIYVQVIKTPVHDATGSIVGAQAVFWDVTERKVMEDQLHCERELMRGLMEACPDAIYFKDLQSRFLKISTSIVPKLGLADPSEAIGKTDADFFGSEHAQAALADEQAIIRTGQPVISKMEHETGAGHDRWVITTKMPLRDHDGTIVGTFGISRDVTALKRAEEELSVARDGALESARLKAEFLANMSHEIRTPMNGVLGMTDLVLDTELTETQRGYLTMAKSSADGLLAILNDILDFSKIEQRKLDIEAIPLSIRTVFAETLKPLAFRADQKGVEIVCHVASDVPGCVLGDPHRIRQILVNLVGNAIKFTDRGQILVTVAVGAQREGVVELHCSVADSGIGVPENKQKTIFEPFSQADGSTTRRFGGTGLGLAIVSNLVELMSGRLWVESVPQEGSTFHFTIPFGNTDQRPEVRSVNLTDVHALVIDDDAINRQILMTWLRRWGMRPAEASNGAQGLDALRAARGEDRPFELVLLDANMPDMNGFEVARRIRDEFGPGGVAVLMVTSSAASDEPARCRELGIAERVTKPVDQRELLAAIGRTLGKDSPTRVPQMPSLMQPGAPPERRLRVLLAEDNIVNQRVAAGILQKKGHAVTIVSDGQSALDALDQDQFDLVLMDVQMPVLGGFEATAELRARERATGRRRMPVIAMTAHAMAGDRERCLAAGMDDYISKPVNSETLNTLAQSVVATAH